MYNVFKRPMFKRGGPTKGTGIMSHVEPRVKAATGFPNFGANPMTPEQVANFRDIEAKRLESIRNQPSFFLGPRFTDPNFQSPFKNFFSNKSGFEFLYPGGDKGLPTIIADVEPKAPVGKTGVEIGLEGPDGITEYQYSQPDLFEQQEKEKEIKKQIINEPKEKIKTEPTYEGSDIKQEVEKEAAVIKDLLKDEGYSKGELALLVAGAIGTPGSISDKLDKARELAIPFARKRREEDKAVTLAAYKFAKEKQREEIKAGKGTEYQRNLRDIARATANQPGEKRSANQIYDELLAAKSPGSEVRLEQLNKISPNILEAAKDIFNLKNELSKAKTDKDRLRIQEDINRKLSLIEQVKDYPEFDVVFPGLKTRVGLKTGGRVKLAEGTEVKDDIITSDVSFGSGSETTSEPVQQLSYQELRDRLPAEITDDVVNLIANNAEALQEFAYIRTQEDVNGFNVKYGVNLVIPPSRA